jgi:hypothetical protein
VSSTRGRVLTALFGRLRAIPLAAIRRNDVLPQAVPAGGLVLLGDGDRGQPDVSLMSPPRRCEAGAPS